MASNYRVTKEDIEDLLSKSECKELVLWDKDYILSFRLPNGFTVLGRASCVDPENFDPEVGRKIAYDDAINNLWPLLGYQMQERLAAKS